MDRVNFHNFKAQTACGARQRVFGRNPFAADYTPLQEFSRSTFTDVEDAAMAWFEPSPAGWATIDDCGEWPCTGPENLVMTFTGTQFAGNQKPSIVSSTFQLVSSFPDKNMEADFVASGHRQPGEAYGCREKTAWNGFYCQNRNIGLLLFESLDPDTMDRSLQPIEIYSEGSKFYTKVNSFMDHVWDGFYTG
jgi:hypothetical protein